MWVVLERFVTVRSVWGKKDVPLDAPCRFLTGLARTYV
jgi:hypothetical protein